MRSFVAFLAMVAWSAAVAAIMYQIGFQSHVHDLWWSLGATLVLFIGLIGNVWIFFFIAKETPWTWFKSENKP